MFILIKRKTLLRNTVKFFCNLEEILTTRVKRMHFEKPRVFIFMSFSIPEKDWESLAKELEKVEGIFVVKNLPANSSDQLSFKMYKLKKKGASVTIQVDRMLFKKYQVRKTPTIIIEDTNDYYKISGPISLYAALEQIEAKNASALCAHLKERIRKFKVSPKS